MTFIYYYIERKCYNIFYFLLYIETEHFMLISKSLIIILSCYTHQRTLQKALFVTFDAQMPRAKLLLFLKLLLQFLCYWAQKIILFDIH